MTSPPYDQQGTALDTALGVQGWWVQYAYIFLFLPPPDQRFTEIRMPTGDRCFGFNIIELAAAFTSAGPLAISPSDLLLNNQIGSLSVTEQPGPLTRGATNAIDFIFGLPTGARVKASVKSAPIAGRA